MSTVIECVPNFSEGCNDEVIAEIASAIRSVEGVKLLNVDAGKSANRTVMTFAGSPGDVIEAAYLAIKTASVLIDMRTQKGEHPRIGATDVCPLIPISGITIEEVDRYAQKLGARVGEELNIPIYMYEDSQKDTKRNNLAIIRNGEYEGLADKIKTPEWQPDYGPSKINTKAGATVIGARDFLIAYNINLSTTAVQTAKIIAKQVRESGALKREGNTFDGKLIKDKNDNTVQTPGSLKFVKAIGWYIKEYDCAQVSMNLTNFKISPLHVVFEEVCKKALEQDVKVTGSELIGLIPLNAMLEAGKHFQKKQQLTTNNTEKELITIAVNALGLNELSTFNPTERIIEYLL